MTFSPNFLSITFSPPRVKATAAAAAAAAAEKPINLARARSLALEKRKLENVKRGGNNCEPAQPSKLQPPPPTPLFN